MRVFGKTLAIIAILWHVSKQPATETVYMILAALCIYQLELRDGARMFRLTSSRIKLPMNYGFISLDQLIWWVAAFSSIVLYIDPFPVECNWINFLGFAGLILLFLIILPIRRCQLDRES
jgi:hypothetical protein